MTDFKTRRVGLLVGVLLTLALAAGSCAPLQPPGATGPRGNEASYPLLLASDDQRREAAQSAVDRLLQPSDTGPSPQLQRVTATIESLPANPSRPLYLPKLGTAAVMTEEETRESLRRFIREWQELIGADPAKLSLVSRVDQPDGMKLATYEQRPFRYPIRGNFGKLLIRFVADRRVLNISSTCIPDADRLQTALASITPRLLAEDVITAVRTNPIKYSDASDTQLNLTLPDTSEISPRELVTYIVPSKRNADALEFHLAWEVELTNAPVKKIYVDAVNGEIIAAE
jgi:hypothetical protein